VAVPAAASPSDLAAYIKARAADADGAVDVAARGYARVLNAAPGDTNVALRAFREALDAGDYALADRAAATLGAQAPADAALLAIAKAARAGDPPGPAIKALDRGPLRIIAAPLRAWAAFDAGADPLAALAGKPGDIVARRFAEETRALILLAQGKTAAGLAALDVAIGQDQGGIDLRIAAAQLLIGSGRTDEAKALLVGSNAAIAALREKPGKGEKPSLAFGASWLFTRIASDLAAGPPGPLSVALTRAALRADPGIDRARLLLANTLAQDGATAAALATLAMVDRDGPYAGPADAGRIQILAEAGEQAKALTVAEALAAERDARSADIRRFADLLIAADRPTDAAAQYRRLLDRGGADADWVGWLQYAAALDAAKRWPQARAALEKSVALAPDEPQALNYLGYAKLERGEDVAAAQAMLERASRLAPDDAAITDSLGWAYYLRGQPARALPLLERAAVASPDNAEIGEHLGDVYWMNGRRFEARYAWRAAQLVAADDARTRLSGKIADGLPSVP